MTRSPFATKVFAELEQLWQVVDPQRFQRLADSVSCSSTAALALFQAEAAVSLAASIRLLAIALALFVGGCGLWLVTVATVGWLVYVLTLSVAWALGASFAIQLLALGGLLMWARALRQHLLFPRTRAQFVRPANTHAPDPSLS